MKRSLYPRLALTGIGKNKRLYLPYLCSAVGMTMMYYILESVGGSSLLGEIRGGRDIRMILSLGRWVIALFSLVFLFYTNSFLIRRRYREFGLYNVLGMDKGGIGRVVMWDSLFTAGVGLLGGVGLGIAFSKLFELGLLNAVHAEIDYTFRVDLGAVGRTALLFGGIFLLLMIKSLWQVRRARPLELLRSEAAGERPPRARLPLAILGLLLLGGAYWMAVTIRDPLDAMAYFFVAVLMVIAATYLLFIVGSVTLCRLLQRRKRYYYRKEHFVSVSSMAFRMKRNGAGLASICILSTMALVTLSSTTALYFGIADTLSSHYPQENYVCFSLYDPARLTDGTTDAVFSAFDTVSADRGITPENAVSCRYVVLSGLLKQDGTVQVPPDASLPDLSRLCNFFFMSADDYAAATGRSVSVGDGEVLLSENVPAFDGDRLCFDNLSLTVAGYSVTVPDLYDVRVSTVPAVITVVDDYDAVASLFENAEIRVYRGFDTDLDDPDEEYSLLAAMANAASDTVRNESYGYSLGSLAIDKSDFYNVYGGLFFIGIILSAVFIFAAVMIIYYKQVSEGYEDRARFAIMQKVGMTRDDIRRSVNAQVLTVFFAPLLTAGLHLGFAFPLVWRILVLFGLERLGTAVAITAAAFLAFAVFYAVVYKLTARAYYSIVAD